MTEICILGRILPTPVGMTRRLTHTSHHRGQQTTLLRILQHALILSSAFAGTVRDVPGSGSVASSI
jgi:hypothetical protein